MVILPLERDTDPGFPVDEDSLKVEKWLDSHPDFVQDYFSRKATRALIDGWLYDHSGEGQAAGGGNPLGIDMSPAGSNSRAGSGANTPVRKISTQEFDKRGQVLKPMVFTVDGMPSFSSKSCVPENSSPPKPRRRRSDLKVLDERELMYELLLDICNDLDMTSLYHKILQNVCILLGADRCSLFLVEGERNSANFCLCSKLFDVSSRSTIQDSIKSSQEIRIPWGTGIVGHVALTGEALNIPDAYEDPRFNKDVDQKTGYKTRNILCMPVKDFHGQVIGVAQAINKTIRKSERFNNNDEKVFKSYLAFCGIGIMNAKMYERSVLENRRSQLLLDLAWLIFEEQSNVAKLIHKIMLHTQSLLRCQRCQVLLVDEANQGKFLQVFDFQESDLDNDSYRREGNLESRFPLNIGITGQVALTGETLNIPDAYLDDRFDPEVDKNGFRTKNILCMPVKNAQGVVIAVVQLINKLDGTAFSVNDENLFEAFAVFCGMGISNTHMYEKAVRAMARQRVALDVLSYHSSATSEEVQRLKKMSVPSIQQYSLTDYHFSDFGLDDDDTLKATVRMFLDLRFLEKFHISYDVFLKWLLSVKKNYRAVAYHNWRHAFNVAQTMFAMILHGRLTNVLNDLESLALLVGCLSHDLDHRGTNNQFQIKTMSPLAQLYSTSTMERHHFDHCLMIINTKGNEILGNLNEDDYKKMVGILEEAILATDLALYFKNRCEFFLIVDRDTINLNDDGHRTLLRSMMMTACDLSAITKPWQIQEKVAELIANEFFEQGDLEKKELKEKPIDMMDRDKRSLLPVMQISFIDSICMPLYQAFAKFNVAFQPLVEGCQSNRCQWQQLAESATRDNDGEKARENIDKGEEITSL